MLVEQLKKFDQLKFDLEQAIQLDDTDRVDLLDKEYSKLWNEILSLDPVEKFESRMLLKFLTDQICELMDYSQTVKQISEQIIHLYDQKVADQK